MLEIKLVTEIRHGLQVSIVHKLDCRMQFHISKLINIQV